MKVIAAINGSLNAEQTAILALTYAKEQEIDLQLLYVKNHKDSLEQVKKSAQTIESYALKENVSCELVILKGHPTKAIRDHFKVLNVDTFFCSTRMKASFIKGSLFTNTFCELLLKMGLNTDIAIVRIVKLHSFKTIENILLPIKQSKLSVKKFSFLSTVHQQRAKAPTTLTADVSRY